MHRGHPELCSQKVLVLKLVFPHAGPKTYRCFCRWVNVTCDSSSEVELYPSSWNRGADERGLEVGDAGRGMQGVRGLCGPGGSIGAVVVLLAEAASGD